MQNAQALPISSVPNPSAPPGTLPLPKTPGRRLGRTALVIHLLAWLAFGVAWALMGLLGEYSPESQATQGVGGATALAFAAWSGLLALRAIWYGERVGWPIFILVAVGAEATVPCLWLWEPLLNGNNPLSPLFEFALWAGLPLVVPFFVFGSVLAVPVAWISVWAMERWKRKLEGEPWTRHRRLKAGLLPCAAVFLLLLIGIFPYGLYAYVALEQNHRNIWSSPFNWQGPVLARIPDFIRTGLDEFSCNHLPWRFVRHRVTLIETGQLPKDRLRANMQDPWEEVQAAAWRVFFRDHRAEAFAQCMQLMNQDNAEQRLRATWNFWHGRVVFGVWSSKPRQEWVTFLMSHLDDPDFRVRRGIAHVLQACLNKPAQLKLPWPWDKKALAERAGEKAVIEEVRAVAEDWLDEQRK